MGAPKGNKNAKGKKTGRKSAYQEKADATLLARMFFDKMSRRDIKKLLKSGNYSIKDSFMASAFAGSEKRQLAIFNKLFPDKIVPVKDEDIIVPVIIKKGDGKAKKG